MVKEVIEIDVRTKEGKAKLKELQTGVKDVGTTSKEASKDINALGGAADKATGGAISGFNALKGTVGSAIRQFGVLRLAVAATGIGALVLAISSLKAAFTASEEGQNKFAKIMTQISVVTGNVVDILSDLGESIFAAGKALVKLATGDLKGASEAWGELKTNISEVVDGVKNFGEETRKEIKVAGELADARAKADRKERALIVERAEANRRIAELREKAADKENVSVQERIEALQEAGRINEEITNKEIEAARLRFEAKKTENALSKSTKEDLDEEAQLQARLIELETARLQKQKSLTAEVTTARREAAAEEKAAESEAEKKRLEELKGFRDAEAQYEKELADKKKKIADAEQKDREDSLRQTAIIEQQKRDLVGQTFGAIAGILGENSKAGKAAAIAQATINTYQGITEVLGNKTTLPEPFGTIQKIVSAGTVLASGLKAVRSIKSQQLPNISGARGGGGSIGSAAAPSLALPSFNVVGQSATNQLAETIAGQQQKPIKAYVVSNDVTNAQSLERNIIEGASI